MRCIGSECSSLKRETTVSSCASTANLRYMLWSSGGAPFSIREDRDLSDCSGSRVYLIGDVRNIFYQLRTSPEWEDVVVCVASCTDEPSWARECMRKFEVGPVDSGISLEDCVDVEEITKGNKQGHLKRIAEATGIQLEEMLFFDNELIAVQASNRQHCHRAHVSS